MYAAIIKQSNVRNGELGGHSSYKAVPINDRGISQTITAATAAKYIKKAIKFDEFENYPKLGFFTTIYKLL